jgi:hypothetical protein
MPRATLAEAERLSIRQELDMAIQTGYRFSFASREDEEAFN